MVSWGFMSVIMGALICVSAQVKEKVIYSMMKVLIQFELPL